MTGESQSGLDGQGLGVEKRGLLALGEADRSHPPATSGRIRAGESRPARRRRAVEPTYLDGLARTIGLTRADALIALVASLVSGTVYWLGSAPGMLFGDGGELQFAAWTAGLPHPTGYPLYMLLGWGWTHLLDTLGLATPARAMNLLSVLLAACAVGLTYLLTRALIELAVGQSVQGAPRSAQRLAALIAALTFAMTPTFWSQALVTEVYALHAVFVALLLGLSLRWLRDLLREKAPETAPGLTFRSRPARPLMVLALLLGLSLAHHRTTLLLVPVLVLFVWRLDGHRLRRPRWLLVLGLLAILPLLLYLYVPLRAPQTPYLTLALGPGAPLELVDRSPKGLIDYVLGQSFAGELQGVGPALADASGLPFRFLTEFGPVGVGLAFLGLIVLAVSKNRRLLWLTAGSFLALTGFNLFYTIGDIDVFYIGPTLIAACWVGVGAAFVAQEVFRLLCRLQSRRKASQLDSSSSEVDCHAGWPSIGASLLLLVPLLALPLSLFLSHGGELDRSGHTRPERWWARLLETDIPADAILVSNDRDEMMPLWYLQQVESVRTDLAGIFPGLMPGEDWADVGRVLEQALATDRPVYLVKPMPGLEVKTRLGLNDGAGLVPVEGPAATQPPQRAAAPNAVIGDTMRLVGYDVAPRLAGPGDTVNVRLYWQPVRDAGEDYTSYLHLLSSDGATIAQSDKLAGGVYYPTSIWKPGEVLVDQHRITIPEDAPPGPYKLSTGLYKLEAGEVQPLGSLALGGSVGGELPPAGQDVAVRAPLYANFNDEILLIGYDIAAQNLVTARGFRASARPNVPLDELQVTLFWQAARPLASDYTVFIHVLSPTGNIVAQTDAQPFAGRYPTSVWQQGELLADTYRLRIPASLFPGIYRVAVGLYEADELTQPRLPAYDDQGQRFPNARVDLANIEFESR